MAFAIGTCRESFDHDRTITYAHSSAVTANTPIYVTGLGVLIPMNSASANVNVTYRRRGIVKFIIANSITLTVGLKVWYDSTNGVITTTVPSAGYLLGTVVEAGTGNSTGTVLANVNINVFGEEGNINVYGSNGTFKASYATIDLAVAALVENDRLKIKSGSYTLSDSVTISVPGVWIIGEDGVVINDDSDADQCFTLVLGALAAAKSVYFRNLHIVHNGDATQVGIQLNNTSAAYALTVDIKNVKFTSGGGNNIDVDHGDTSNEIILKCENCEFDDAVNVVVADNADVFRFKRCKLGGGFVSDTGAFTAEILFENCIILHEGVTGGASQQTIYSCSSVSETGASPNVYAAADTADFAGSHTESLIVD